MQYWLIPTRNVISTNTKIPQQGKATFVGLNFISASMIGCISSSSCDRMAVKGELGTLSFTCHLVVWRILTE